MKNWIASFLRSEVGFVMVLGLCVALIVTPVVIAEHVEKVQKADNEYRLELARIQNGARLEQVRVGVPAGATPPPN